MVSDTELADAMSHWVQYVTEQLSNKISDTSIVGQGGQGWQYDQDGRIVFRFRNAYFKRWMIENLLFENDAWNALEKISRDHARMAMHCDTPVGTPYHGVYQSTARDLCCGLLPKPVIAEHGILPEGAEVVTARITALIDEFNSDHIFMKTIWPVRGMRVSQPIDLDDEQSFRPLTAAEKLSALNFKMIEAHEGQTFIDPSFTDWFGLVLTERFQKHFGHIDVPKDFMEQHVRRETCLELFLSVAPAVGDFVAFHAGGYSHAPRFSSLGLLSRGETGYGVGHAGGSFLVTELSPILTLEQATRFANVWKLVSHADPKNNKSANALRNAIRRLFYAETRTSSEDRLVDLIVAAESIYTMDSQAELSFRLSLNAALWHDGSNLERRAVFREIKDAYGLRSKIVHGSIVDSDKVALAASKVRGILKAGIAKAIDNHFLREFPPKWEDLVLPELEH